MNKKILISLSVIGLVAAIAIGGTIAFFSDTETSTGNTFTAGELNLTIDNECWKGGEYTYGSDCSWDLKDLEEGVDFFFNFSDLKPGDWGEDTVSLHVTNDAWACVAFQGLSDDDNSCTEPEQDAEENNCHDPGMGEGELAENLFFGFWADMCDGRDQESGFPYPEAFPGDNIYQDVCDEILTGGWADEIIPGETYTLAAPGEINVFTGEEGEPLTGSEDYYIGKVWCFGEWTEGGKYEYYCDGSDVGNESQTDSLSGDIIFYAEQARNNPDFVCGEQ